MYFPREIIVQSEVVDHPVTEKIIARSPESSVIVCDLPAITPDSIILKQYSKLYSEALSVADRKKLGRKIMFLHKSDNIITTMAAGSNPLKCCHNFKKLAPYKAACLFNCEYCWFKDPDLMIRVNVAFFDHLDRIENIIEENARLCDTVFTFTHYKTDCLSIEHLTGFTQDLVRYFAASKGYLILLTKSSITRPLLNLQHNGHTIMQWSINAADFTRKYERGAASLTSRLRAAKRLKAENYPIVFRIDPIFAFDNWREQYRLMVDTIFEFLKPDHITLGVARFQGPDEIQQIITNGYGHKGLLDSQQDRFVFAKLNASDGYKSAENPFENTMADMPFTYPDELRYELLRNIVAGIREHDATVSIGICEESREMWDELGVMYRGNKNLDCACNYTGFKQAE